MPVVTIEPNYLFKLMEVPPMKEEELRQLLLRFGLELDDVVEEEGITKYKIDVPANRADLLCVEEIAINLKCFLGEPHPKYNILPPTTKMIIKESVANVRPYIVCAVIKDIQFTDESVKSFIDYQDKLHQGLARRRTLASIGTHDLDTVVGPFTYSAEKPEDIVFVPLMGGPEVNGRELYKNLQSHQQLSRYLPLLDPFDTWPVVRDGKGRVMSLPPIINSELSKITVDTKNIFVECTATDLTRAVTAVISLCAAFSFYCKNKFTIEQVEIEQAGKTYNSPEFKYTEFIVDTAYIQSLTNLPELNEADIIALLQKMQLDASDLGNGQIKVIAPPTRADVLHACDIAEDVAIAYGYDNIDKKSRKKIQSGRPLVINEYSDRLAKEFAGALYSQILPFSLCSRRECYEMLRLEDDGLAVALANPKTTIFEIVRTNLLAGILKTGHNILEQPKLKNVLPLRLFDISDIVLQDKAAETQTRNERHVAAAVFDVHSRFEEIHGLLDRFFVLNRCSYKLEREDCPTCITGQRAAVIVDGKKVGWIGVIHPQVLINFELTKPVAAFELQLQPFVDRK